MKIGVKRLARDEKGAAMVLALIMLLIGGLVSAPLLAHMGTGIVTGEVYEVKTAELYAADAGVEDAVWNIQHEVPEVMGLTSCYPDWSYNMSNVNGKSVDVKIEYKEIGGQIYYKITSIATTDSNSHTTVESYVEFIPGGELNIFGGALASEGDITLGKDSTVNGDIYYCGDFDDGGNLAGNWTDNGCTPFPSQDENERFAQVFEDEALNGTTYNGNMDINSNTTLGSPNHISYITGNLVISNAVTITLDGIVYVKGSISASKDLTITGSGSIVAEGDIYLSKLANYTVTGDSIIMSLNGDITIKKSDPAHELSINALIYAPNGAIIFDKDMTVVGGVVGQSIQVDKEGSFTFVPKTSWDFPGELPGALEIKTYSINQ